MATYQHGVYNQEQATSLTTPIQSSAALAQVTLLGLIPSPNAQTKRKIRLTKGIAINRIAKNHSTVETV